MAPSPMAPLSHSSYHSHLSANFSSSVNLMFADHDTSQTLHHGANLAPATNIPRVNSLNAIPSVFGSGSKIVSNVYHVIWKAMYTLAADPHPRISSAAQIIIDEIRSRLFTSMSSESLKESKSNSSISESSSPNTVATFSISESPPSSTTTTYVGRKNVGDVITTSTTHTFSSSPNRSSEYNQCNRDNGGNSQPHPPPPPPMPNINQSNMSSNQSNSSQQFSANSSNVERITKSANVAINKARRYISNRDSNISEDDVRSNLSSQKPLITTDFVDWCTKYFVDPENNFSSARNSSSREEQQREWRMLRVLSYKNVCLRELMVIDPIKFGEKVISSKVSQVPNLLAVHPYDPIMVIAGREDFSIIQLDGPHVNNYLHSESSGLSSIISSASIAPNQTLIGSNVNNHHHHNNHYSNGNDSHSHDLIGTQRNCHSSSSQITSLQLINPQYNTLICTGSSEGSVRIWRAYNGIDYSFNPQLISAFHLMPELQSHRQGSGMILLWDQHQSQFYATSDQSDVRIIKVWDATSESKVQDIPTCAEFGVSCLSSDGEHSIAAGFLDGSIRIYDTRLKKTDCRTFTFRKHSEKILTLHMFKPGEKHINLVSGDSGGEVRFWDKRAPTSVKRVDVGQKMSVMSVHPNADVFAW